MRYLSLLILLVGLKASATTILISDVDDTIRQTNVHNLGSLAVLKSYEFGGMAKLYEQILKRASEVDYVTGTPLQLKGSVDFFVAYNYFPIGNIYARDTQVDTVTHKIAVIKKIIEQNKPEELILVGDDGEQDPVTYSRIAKDFSGKAQIYIHQIYDTAVALEHHAWLTSIDLAMLLYANGTISSEGLDAVIDFTLPKLFASRVEREKVLPAWGECKTFYRNFSRPQISLTPTEEEKIRKYEAFLKTRCS